LYDGEGNKLMLFARSADDHSFGFAVNVRSFLRLARFLNPSRVWDELNCQITNSLSSYLPFVRLIEGACIGKTGERLDLITACLAISNAFPESSYNIDCYAVFIALLGALTQEEAIKDTQESAAKKVAQEMFELVVPQQKFSDWVKMQSEDPETVIERWRESLENEFEVRAGPIPVCAFDLFFLSRFVQSEQRIFSNKRKRKKSVFGDMASVMYGVFRSEKYTTNCWNSFIPAFRDEQKVGRLHIGSTKAVKAYEYLNQTFFELEKKENHNWDATTATSKYSTFFPHSEIPLRLSSRWTERVDNGSTKGKNTAEEQNYVPPPSAL